MGEMRDGSLRDEDAVAEIPPGEDAPGSVQGGGSDILRDDDAGTGGNSAQADVGRLDPLEPEVSEEDKGGTGE